MPEAPVQQDQVGAQGLQLRRVHGLPVILVQPDRAIGEAEAQGMRDVQVGGEDRTADHIQALGKISRLMADAAVRERAYAAETSDDLYRLLTEEASP